MVLVARPLRLASVLGLLLLSACSNVQQPRVVPAVPSEAPIQTQPEQPAQTRPAEPVQTRPVQPPTPTTEPGRATTPPVATSLINQASQAIRQEQWLNAERALEKALRIAPNEAKIYLTYGSLYQQTGDHKKARQMLLRAVSLAGEHSPVGQSARTQLAILSQER